MRIDKNSVDNQREDRAMRARYIGDLLSSGWNAVFGVFRSAAQLLKRTLISFSRFSGEVSRL
jgi:hypothetical protein